MSESPSMEHKKYASIVCPEFAPMSIASGNIQENVKRKIICDRCLYWDSDRCIIFDSVLTSIDQT